MSSAPFPQLLRRSTFAAHDPFISRVHTSTPSSIHQYGDWGLKYPIPRSKGPRYIKFNTLDAGKVIGADWRSAEQEARFVQTWGTGRVSWMSEDELPKYKTRSGVGLWDNYALPPEEAEGERKVELMEDVNAMNPKEFGIYLEKVRRKRKEFLKTKLDSLRRQTRDKLTLPEDQTLITLGAKGHVVNPDTAGFQVSLTKEELEKANSRVLHAPPHRVHGLSYSRLPPTSGSFNPMLHHPGRAIDRVSQYTEASDRARNMRPGEGTNRPWVVDMGGIGTKSKTTAGRISDISAVPKGVDFTREEPHRGEARWRVTTASMKDPPRVLGLQQLNDAQRSSKRGRPQSAAKQMSPLDTFRFDITVKHVSSASPKTVQDPEDELGSREWVGREPRTQKVPSTWSDELGLGGPRSDRKPGEGAKQLRSWEQQAQREAREDSAARVSSLLARLSGKTP